MSLTSTKNIALEFYMFEILVYKPKNNKYIDVFNPK